MIYRFILNWKTHVFSSRLILNIQNVQIEIFNRNSQRRRPQNIARSKFRIANVQWRYKRIQIAVFWPTNNGPLHSPASFVLSFVLCFESTIVRMLIVFICFALNECLISFTLCGAKAISNQSNNYRILPIDFLIFNCHYCLLWLDIAPYILHPLMCNVCPATNNTMERKSCRHIPLIFAIGSTWGWVGEFLHAFVRIVPQWNVCFFLSSVLKANPYYIGWAHPCAGAVDATKSAQG